MNTIRKADLLQKRRWRIRKKVFGTAARPRFAVRFTTSCLCELILACEVDQDLREFRWKHADTGVALRSVVIAGAVIVYVLDCYSAA